MILIEAGSARVDQHRVDRIVRKDSFILGLSHFKEANKGYKKK
jgi:hypothetical protein